VEIRSETQRPLEVYDSAKRPIRPLDEILQVVRFRHLIVQLLRRDILTRYKRSVLGVVWTMLNPLGMMIVLTLAFSTIFGRANGYPAYVLSGLLAWNFFAQTTNAAMVNLIWGGGLLHRVFIPRTSFSLAAIGTGVVNIVLSLVPMLLVMLVTGIPIYATQLFLPIPIFLLACFALGCGLLLSTLAVYFPDVVEMYQIGITAWLYLTPVMYPESILPDTTRTIIQTLNPMYGLLHLFRIPILDGRIPTLAEVLPSAAMALLALVVGWWAFTENSDAMSYRI
jgi:ABC-type polysaccharide/polyol phosphate export permease